MSHSVTELGLAAHPSKLSIREAVIGGREISFSQKASNQGQGRLVSP